MRHGGFTSGACSGLVCLQLAFFAAIPAGTVKHPEQGQGALIELAYADGVQKEAQDFVHAVLFAFLIQIRSLEIKYSRSPSRAREEVPVGSIKLRSFRR